MRGPGAAIASLVGAHCLSTFGAVRWTRWHLVGKELDLDVATRWRCWKGVVMLQRALVHV